MPIKLAQCQKFSNIILSCLCIILQQFSSIIMNIKQLLKKTQPKPSQPKQPKQPTKKPNPQPQKPPQPPKFQPIKLKQFRQADINFTQNPPSKHKQTFDINKQQQHFVDLDDTNYQRPKQQKYDQQAQKLKQQLEKQKQFAKQIKQLRKQRKQMKNNFLNEIEAEEEFEERHGEMVEWANGVREAGKQNRRRREGQEEEQGEDY